MKKSKGRLHELKTELQLEFGKDLWDKCLQKQRGKGTTEDMYWWYKKQCKMGQTPSEIAITLGRKTTKRFEINIYIMREIQLLEGKVRVIKSMNSLPSITAS